MRKKLQLFPYTGEKNFREIRQLVHGYTAE